MRSFRTLRLCSGQALSLLAVLLAACQPLSASPVPVPPSARVTASSLPRVTTAHLPTSPAVPVISSTPRPLVPYFSHIVVVVLENKEYGFIAGNTAEMPNFNRWAKENTLLTQHYAVIHPSLPNYIAIMGGDTFGINRDCTNCFVNAPSLPDQIETAGLTWKAYEEDMPRPCYLGDTATYVQKHNPFIYFDPIRLNAARCESSIVPLTALDTDIAAGTLPNFAFVMPNICNSAHDCGLATADAWLGIWVGKLLTYLTPRAETEPYLIILTWDEGQGNHSCCGLPKEAGGRVATVLISPLAKSDFQDDTPYTHYSILKTIEAAWGLPFLGRAADENNVLITAPWK